MLSLIAAKRSQIELHTNTLPRAKKFLMSTCTDRDYWFGYKRPPGEPTTTAIGLTLMLYLGESPEYTPFYNALTKLSERGPTLNNIYHDYYATLALHHSRHPDWDRWNTKLRDHLVATQAKSGHEKGSWHFKDRWGDIGGRLYTTAMCCDDARGLLPISAAVRGGRRVPALMKSVFRCQPISPRSPVVPAAMSAAKHSIKVA